MSMMREGMSIESADASSPVAFHASGSPAFAGVARRGGGDAAASALAAWRQAVREQGHKGAAANATGDFAVGIREHDGRAFMAVDRFAVRTLCYRIVEGRLEFAARADELAGPAPTHDTQANFD